MSHPKRSNKLFHTIVIVGASLTGGAAAIACGSSTDSTCADNTPMPCSYAQIAYNPDAYAHIADGYAQIAYNPDAYAHISIDSGSDTGLVDAADAAADAPSDASDSG